jgi:GAF domain-containing protein
MLSSIKTASCARPMLGMPSMPEYSALFRTVTRNKEFSPGVGLPGTALQTAKPVWVEDLKQDQNFPRLRFAERAGLKCGVAFPVLSGPRGGGGGGVLQHRNPRARRSALLDLMAQAGTQLGRAIERQNAQDRLEARR